MLEDGRGPGGGGEGKSGKREIPEAGDACKVWEIFNNSRFSAEGNLQSDNTPLRGHEVGSTRKTKTDRKFRVFVLHSISIGPLLTEVLAEALKSRKWRRLKRLLQVNEAGKQTRNLSSPPPKKKKKFFYQKELNRYLP